MCSCSHASSSTHSESPLNPSPLSSGDNEGISGSGTNTNSPLTAKDKDWELIYAAFFDFQKRADSRHSHSKEDEEKIKKFQSPRLKAIKALTEHFRYELLYDGLASPSTVDTLIEISKKAFGFTSTQILDDDYKECLYWL